MFKLSVATLAALYCVLYLFGDETRRAEAVSRSEPLGFQLISAAALPAHLDELKTPTNRVSDSEAVKIAILTGKEIREARKANTAKPQIEIAAAKTAAATSDATPAIDYWFVTGSKVNLRQGPGTSNAVVGQVAFGDQAEVLSDRDGWYEIRLADGSNSGWIFGKFLKDQLPG